MHFSASGVSCRYVMALLINYPKYRFKLSISCWWISTYILTKPIYWIGKCFIWWLLYSHFLMLKWFGQLHNQNKSLFIFSNYLVSSLCFMLFLASLHLDIPPSHILPTFPSTFRPSRAEGADTFFFFLFFMNNDIISKNCWRGKELQAPSGFDNTPLLHFPLSLDHIWLLWHDFQ